MTGFEAVCESCGETFNPTGPGDLEHVEKSDGVECGGPGHLVGGGSGGLRGYLNRPCDEVGCDRVATHNQPCAVVYRVCNAHLDPTLPAFARND